MNFKSGAMWFIKIWAMIFVLGCNQSEAKNSGNGVDFGAPRPPMEKASNRADLNELRYAISNMVEKVGGVVVSIQTMQTVKQQARFRNPIEEFFFGSPFGPMDPMNPPKEEKQQSLGSGVIVSEDGYILTNNHVVEGADEIRITMLDQKEYKAEIVGLDKQTDLAVIKVTKKIENLPVAYIGNSDSLKVGEWVVAIGNPFGLNHTVTSGIVSAKGIHNRGLSQYENFIQTDAAINPGNSGGALFNLSGELVGINSAILSKSGGFMGIGFAIPINMAKRIAEDLIKGGKVERGWLGVSIQDVDQKLAQSFGLERAYGALITEILEGAPAEKSGLQAGDLIISINGEELKNANDLRNTIALIKPGTEVELGILRGEKKMIIKAVVGARQTDETAMDSNNSNESKNKSLGIAVAVINDEIRRQLRLKPEDKGLVIVDVADDSPAMNAGLKEGDVIISIDRREVKNFDGFREVLKNAGKKSPLLFLVKRGEGKLFIAVETAE